MTGPLDRYSSVRIPDGIIGANTRKAIRSAQQSFGWPADGYPTHELLEALRKPVGQ